jgi:hypothetical protein
VCLHGGRVVVHEAMYSHLHIKQYRVRKAALVRSTKTLAVKL